MKKIILICLTIITFGFSDSIELNLTDFSIYASEENNVNILIDESLSDKNFVFTISDKNDYYLPAFEKALSIHNLELIKTNKIYYVREIGTYIEKAKYRALKLNFVNYEDIKNFLDVYKDIKFEFIQTSKILMIYSNETEFESIKETIETIDTLPKQLKLKITILDTNLNKLRELGSSDSMLNLSTGSDFFFNLIAYPFSSTNIISNDKKSGFYNFLKFINDDGISDFISNPILTLTDGKKNSFNVVSNTPFKTGESTLQDTQFRTSNSFDYRDVGLKIEVTPRIYKDDNVYLDLNLELSNIVSLTAQDMPVTSKKSISQSFHLSKDNIMILSGLNQKETNSKNSGVPILQDIPLAGWLFKYESQTTTLSNLSIIFELVDDYESPIKFIEKIKDWNLN
jgi:general secretion pathway protein D